ncbi:MAG: dihydroneopterin triphosphate diphosphatase [Hydrogenophilales bacterium 12-61-10]|nr:MAG: dihydroneopterin triphosphate diphosphatase [Hydrogenophilales bacterium 12-61-10]OYX27717.1 MAG: dihydroneopterin triphosphate diphosphatase [Hydrogenophilales bacterium 32-62-9]
MPASKTHKVPVSVLVIIHTADGQVLILERADAPGLWQSVTGSQDAGETLEQTAIREVREETGLDASQFSLTDWGIENRYAIFERWLHRYAPGVTHNTEHVFGLCLPGVMPVTLAPREHLQYCWLPRDEAAERCFSPSNAAAIRRLPNA